MPQNVGLVLSHLQYCWTNLTSCWTSVVNMLDAQQSFWKGPLLELCQRAIGRWKITDTKIFLSVPAQGPMPKHHLRNYFWGVTFQLVSDNLKLTASTAPLARCNFMPYHENKCPWPPTMHHLQEDMRKQLLET